MFVNFFYELRENGVPVSPTSFLRLQQALQTGLISNLNDFYTSARAILVKSERYFDLYDQVFAYFFKGADMPSLEGFDLDAAAQALLEQWLKDPDEIIEAMDLDPDEMQHLSPEELIEYFKKKLQEQTEAHHGGNRWIGTRGTSPVGHSGEHPEGMRVGGVSRNMSAVKVAMDRRYRDYSLMGPLTQSQIGEALKRLRHMIPAGALDQVNIDETIRQTVKNAGEIEIFFERRLKDKLKVALMIDNGGWSMDPFVHIVKTLFDYAESSFKDLKTYYFHNTIYDYVWEDPRRWKKPIKVTDFSRKDPDIRLVIVGDASMAPYELLANDGSIHVEERSGRASIYRLRLLSDTFRHSIWLNPVPMRQWSYTRTIGVIADIFPMFELTLDGLEKGVAHLMSKN